MLDMLEVIFLLFSKIKDELSLDSDNICKKCKQFNINDESKAEKNSLMVFL